MKLETKTALFIGTALGALVLTLYFLAQAVIFRGYVALESRRVREDVMRARDALDYEAEGIDRFAYDWAAWDDTYAFVKDRNKKYVASNFVDETFTDARLNFIAIYDSSGTLVLGKAFDLEEEEEIPLPPEFARLSPDSPLLAHKDVKGFIRGLFPSSRGPVIISSRPVIRSDDTGPIRGTLIMGRFLTPEETTRLAALTHLTLAIRGMDSPRLPPALRRTAGKPHGPPAVAAMPLSNKEIAGFTLLSDVFGKPMLALEVRLPRDAYLQGRMSTAYYDFLLVLVGAASVVLVLLLMKRMVISRLLRLNDEVKRIGADSTSCKRLSVRGRDELSDLAAGINAMLDSIERAQAELKRSEERHRGIVEDQTDLISRFTPSCELTYVNDALCRFIGMKKEDLLGRSFLPFLFEEDRKRLEEALASLTPANPAVTFEERVRMPGGDIRWLQWVNRAIYDSEGRAVEYQGVGRDVTGRRLAEIEMRKRLGRLDRQRSAILEISKERFANLDRTLKRIAEIDAKTLDVERVNIWRFTPDRADLECVEDYRKSREVHGSGERLSAERYPRYFGLLEVSRLIVADDARRDPKTSEFTESYLIPHGIISMLDAPVRLGGKTVGVICHEHVGERRAWTEDEQSFAGSMADMVALALEASGRRQAERARLLLDAAIEQAAESVVISDPDGRIQYVNPHFEKVTGYSREEVIGKSLKMLRSGKHDDRFFDEMWKSVKSGRVWTGRITNRRKNGILFEEEVTISPIRDETGTIVSFVQVKRDITQEAALEKQLRHAQRMEAIGTLAGGIAHDFNNILAGIMGYAALIERETVSEAALRDARTIEKLSRRGADLTGALLTFARRADYRLAPLNLNEIVQDVLKLIGRTSGKGLEIRSELSPDIPNVMGDEGQLNQVVLNLCINACESMQMGGVLTVRTRTVKHDAAFYAAHPLLKRRGLYVSVSVADTGVGMDENTKSRIFEPFYTTKVERSGTGLGLSIVSGIVEQHSGCIDVESEPKRGSVFTVYLPATERAPRKPAARMIGTLRGDETILIVDDEPAFRNCATRWLKELGYRTIAAADGREALRIIGKKGEKVDLMLLDIIMKKMAGVETFRRAREIREDLPVIILTGYSISGSAERLLREGASDFLQKPFEFLELAVKIRSVLDAG